MILAFVYNTFASLTLPVKRISHAMLARPSASLLILSRCSSYCHLTSQIFLLLSRIRIIHIPAAFVIIASARSRIAASRRRHSHSPGYIVACASAPFIVVRFLTSTPVSVYM